MTVYKTLSTRDIITVPLEVKKGFVFTGGNNLTGSEVGIDRFVGENVFENFNTTGSTTTGYVNTQYSQLVFDSIRHLYFSNFLSASSGASLTTASLIPGLDSTGDRYIGSSLSTGRYENYIQSDITQSNYLSTGSGYIAGVISIPRKLYGDMIEPGSIRINSVSGSLRDDGEGNLIRESINKVCGRALYSHGLLVITSDGQYQQSQYGTASYGSSTYGNVMNTFINSFITSSNITCSFSSSYTIYETYYKCTVGPGEYNSTYNPTVVSESISGSLYNQFTGSLFRPYITTIGLYNDQQELLAVVKLPKPIKKSEVMDTTFLIGIDR